MNVELLLWALVITNIINAACHIIVGCTRAEKPAEYGCEDVFCGIVTLIICIVVVAT